MLKNEIKVGGMYLAKVSGTVQTVRVDAIREVTGVRPMFGRTPSATHYTVTNLRTGRKVVFRSAAKFRGEARPQYEKCSAGCGRSMPEANKPWICIACAKQAREANEEQERFAEHGPTTVPQADPKPPQINSQDTAKADFDLRVQEAIETSPQVEDPCQYCEGDNGRTGSRFCSDACEENAKQEASEESDPTQGSTQSAVSPPATVSATIPAPSAAATAAMAPVPTTDRTSLVVPMPPCTVSWDGVLLGTLGADGVTPSKAGSTSLAARIATSRPTRVLGTPVAGMVPNAEQEEILAAAVQEGLRALVVAAGAGTGKTATLKMLEQVLPGRGQYTAFNTSLVAESKAKFIRASCNTTHSLAFRAVGKLYQHRLGGERMRSSQVARILGVESFPVVLQGQGPPEDCQLCERAGRVGTEPCPACDGNGTVPSNKTKVLQADFLAGQVLVAIRRFCQSADREIGEQHLQHIDGIDVAESSESHGIGFDRGQRSRENNDKVREYLLPFCRRAWNDLSRVDGTLPFNHDCYVKLWQLGQGQDRPIIAADYILLDEAQDTAPVFLDVLKQQEHALLIFVGDSNQQIYEWRGAVDAMRAYPDAERRLLTQSYRFGQAVADVANTVLATLDEPTDLVMRGNPAIPSRVAEVAEPRCYLYRTNAGAVGQVMAAIGESKKPHLIGGGADVVAWCQAAIDLQAGRGTRHLELACFESWAEVVEYSKTDEGSDLKLMVKLVTDFGAEEIRDALRDMLKEEDADLVVSTAHKSKGREWDTVRLGGDFPLANKMGDADRRLLYVAATRAKLVLDVSECPSFCGGNDTRDTGNAETSGAWVPGLEIHYTQPMPSPDDLADYTADRTAGEAPGSPVAARSPAATAATPTPIPSVPTANGNGATGEFTWAKMDGEWCVRGPKDRAGQQVRVVRKNGTSSVATLGKVNRKIGDFWFYEV